MYNYMCVQGGGIHTYIHMGKKQQMKTVSGYHCGLLFDWGNEKQAINESQHCSPFYSLQKYNGVSCKAVIGASYQQHKKVMMAPSHC